MADIYKMEGHKLFWHLDRVNSWTKGKRIVPIGIDMGITQTCNVACRYCYYAIPENRTDKKIPTDALLRLIADAVDIGVKAISFAGDGEPMLHPGVYEAVDAGFRNGIDMAVSTNGVVMNHGKLGRFLGALKWIRFHIGAANAEKYAHVMRTDRKIYSRVIDNIRQCVTEKSRYGLKVTIGIQMILTHESIDQVVPFAKLGKELEVDYAVVKQCSEKSGIRQYNSIDHYKEYEDLFIEAESLSDSVYNMIIKRRKLNDGIRGYNRCYGCEFLSQISGTGDVYACGNYFGRKDLRIGNIIEESYKDIVFGKRYKEVMDRVKGTIDVHKECGQKCRLNEINEFLWMIKTPPPHVNSI